MIVDSTAEVAVLAASKLAETTVCSDETNTAPFPLGLQQREGRCDHYGLDCSQYEYSCYDYDCKHSVTVAAETSTSKLKKLWLGSITTITTVVTAIGYLRLLRLKPL